MVSPALRLVVMGVAGCGKSAVGQLVAAQLGLALIEGDDFHPPENVLKMQQGLALTDHDRAGWLQTLGQRLAEPRGGAVLTCSALKAAYRDLLRQAAGPVSFLHLAITPALAVSRVRQRAGHFYPPSLVESQFEALQDPSAEPGVLTLAVDAPAAVLADKAVAWLARRG
jgi:gluconokinase